MENSLFTLLVAFDSSTLNYVRNVTAKEAVRTLYLRAPEAVKLGLINHDTVIIANFNQLVNYIQPQLNRNTIDRYRREYVAVRREQKRLNDQLTAAAG